MAPFQLVTLKLNYDEIMHQPLYIQTVCLDWTFTRKNSVASVKSVKPYDFTIENANDMPAWAFVNVRNHPEELKASLLLQQKDVEKLSISDSESNSRWVGAFDPGKEAWVRTIHFPAFPRSGKNPPPGHRKRMHRIRNPFIDPLTIQLQYSLPKRLFVY